MPFIFPTRTTSSTVQEHVDDHNLLASLLERAGGFSASNTRAQHLAEHNAIHPTFSLPSRTSESAATHVADSNTLYAEVVAVYAGVRGAVGPQTISQPGGSTTLSPGATTWAETINAGSINEVFWFPSGTYTLGTVTSLLLKSGMKLVGQLGAIIDGQSTKANMTGGGGTANNIEINNLLVQNFTDYAVAFETRTGWIVHHCELTTNQVGLRPGFSSYIHHNYSHHNVKYGLSEFNTTGTIVEDNEFSNDNTSDVSNADQGSTKWMGVANTTVRHNWFHHSQPWGTGNPQGRGAGSAVWFDSRDPYAPSSGNVIEWNLVEDCHQGGIENEIGSTCTIQYNHVRRNDGYHIFISNSDSTEVKYNVIAPNNATTGARAIILQQNTDRNPSTQESNTLHDNNVHNNKVDISVPVSGAPMVGLLVFGAGSDYPTWEAAAKNNLYEGNDYKVLSLTGSYWNFEGTLRTFANWQTLPTPDRDTTGTQFL